MARLTFSEFLTEDRQQQTLGYHGTSKGYLRSILKQGLIPNKSGGGYGSKEISSLGIPLTPLPGVYFTTTGDKAKYIANANYEDPLIVIALVTPNSRTMDEDNFSKLFDPKLIYKEIEKKKSPEIIAGEIMNRDGAFPRLHPSARKAVARYLIDFIKALVVYYEESDAEDFSKERVDDALRKVKQLEYALTKALSYYTKKNDEMSDTNQNTFKIDGAVGFSGRNRIVGIYDPVRRVGWGQLGDFERDAYHVYDSPRDLLPKQ